MQVRVIGIYDTIDEAQATEGDLESEGFRAEDMSIAARDASATREERGVMHFFREILGLDVGPGPAGATAGRYVLTLYADEARAEAATDVMMRHHPLAQRVSEERDVTPASEPVQEDLPKERLTPEEGAVGSIEQSFGGEEALGRQPYEELEHERYRAHFDEYFAAAGNRYEEYLPAYQFGERAAQSSRYKGGAFEDFELEIRRDFMLAYPSSDWDRFKGAIHHAWDKVSGRAV
jgi:hypothetical protein